MRISGSPSGCRFDSCFGMRSAQIRQSAERSGLNPDVCRFESCSGYYKTKRLGRQLADHLGLDPWMLWVRIPPGPLEDNTPSWSSLECSPPCHGGGRRFKSDRGCLNGAVRQLGRATDFKRPWMWVRLPPVLLNGSCSSRLPVKQLSQKKRGGRREVQFLHDPLTNGPFV